MKNMKMKFFVDILKKNVDTFGEHLFTFDKKKIYNLFEDYPQNMSKEEVEIFSKENPYWREFFRFGK